MSEYKRQGIEQEDLVPIPNEVPDAPDFKDIPTYILHSRTVENLIGQNDDLMARLKVSVRQNSILESQLLDIENRIEKLKALNINLSTQNEVLTEKDEMQKQKLQIIENDLKNNKFNSAELSRLRNYHRRVKTYGRTWIEKLKLQASLASQQKSEVERQFMEVNAKLSSYKTKLTETISELTQKEKKHQKDSALLVENYEKQIDRLNQDRNQLERELKLLREKSKLVDELRTSRIESENRAIEFERKLTELELSTHHEIERLKTECHTQSAEIEAYHIRAEFTQTQIQELSQQVVQKEKEAQSYSDRLEAMTQLWNEVQQEREDLKSKIDAQQKLNHELSLKLIDQRKAESQQLEPAIKASIKEEFQ